MSALRQGSPEWLAARRPTVGSSDIPIIAGESPHKDAHTLMAEKLGLIQPEVDAETQELFDIGKILQPALLRIYERKSGRHVTPRYGWTVRESLPWATASLDGTAARRRIVEAKWTNAVRWTRGERIPGDVQAQIQWALFVTGWDVADVVALDHGVPRIETQERNEPFIDNLVFLATAFHEQYERGELPEPDGSLTARRTITRLHPRDDGTVLVATTHWRELAAQLKEAKAAVKAAEDAEGTLANAIRVLLGDASEVDGLLSWRKNADSVRTNWPAVATAYRQLAEQSGIAPDELEAIVSIHSEAAEGARTLRLLKGA